MVGFFKRAKLPFQTVAENHADVVIVGAGPVGLWAAIQAKKRNPDLKIRIYERHQEYQRSHVLKLEAFSLLLYAKLTHDAAERAFFEEVTGRAYDTILSPTAKKSVYVRTNDLEVALKTYAAKLGISIAYETIETPEQAMDKHPNCRHFVAADGARSKMRQAIMGDDDVALDKNDLQYVVEMKYHAEGRAPRLGTGGNYKTNKMLTSMAFEYMGREKNGITPGTIRFFVDKETYDAMPKAEFKDPVHLGDPRIPASLAKDIETYMSVRAKEAGEKYIEGSAKISKLTLSHYVAKDFAAQYKGRNWYLVGDAALGVPYFRSLNAGLIIASQLAFVLTNKLIPNAAKIGAYNFCRPFDAAWEVIGAVGKDAALNMYDAFRQMNSKLPWQVVKWKKGDKDTPEL